jgi:hypothetical protein
MLSWCRLKILHEFEFMEHAHVFGTNQYKLSVNNLAGHRRSVQTMCEENADHIVPWLSDGPASSFSCNC